MNMVLERTENKAHFSSYPKEMDEYFINNKIEIKIVPDEFLLTLEKKCKNIKVTNARQLAITLDVEINYWKEHDPKNTLKDFSKIDTLLSAKNNLDTSEERFKNNQQYDGNAYLKRCVSDLSHGFLSSKTSLAKYIVEYLRDASPEVIRGFRSGISKDKRASVSSTVGDHEGLMMAMQFRRIVSSFVSPSEQEMAQFCENVNVANEQYAELNAKYTESFRNQEEELSGFVEKVNSYFKEMHTNADEYFKERDKHCTELEELYIEKLRLKAPAEYWKRLAIKYMISGSIWLGVSIISAVAIVITLIYTLINMPILISEDSQWLVLFRNSAILTVITSVLVYLVRYFIKMAMSSFHLSRDAKERENLSHFYLALIENSAVSDKERGIILNSLFSRSDSGLLKGDSSPTMSNNPSELIDLLKNKQ